MFSFFKSKPDPTALFRGLGTDMHSHLLPGIDDGSPDMETSLQLIRSMQKMGFERLITTPHIYQGLYPNTPEIILDRLAAVRAALQAANINIQLDAAAEYFLDENFDAQLAADRLLTLPERHVLIEMSFLAPYHKLHTTLFQMQTKGYRPILAHPERYLYYAGDLGRLEQIREYGSLLQVNLLSLSGYYGKPAKNLALKLLEKGWVDYLGTDLHHDRHATHLQTIELGHILRDYTFKNRNWSSSVDGTDEFQPAHT